MVADLREKYEAVPSSRAFKRLYDDPEWGHMFAVLHKRLNEHFTDINGRAETTRHYWADNSRDLLSLIQEIEADLHTLRRAGVEVDLAGSYQDALERCRPWLSPSGGSAVPEDFERIDVIAYEPVFTHAARSVKLQKQQEAIELKMVGSGSYAWPCQAQLAPLGRFDWAPAGSPAGRIRIGSPSHPEERCCGGGSSGAPKSRTWEPHCSLGSARPARP